MITPAFELSQDPTFLILTIRVPYTRTSEFDLYIDGDDFKFYAKPYFLRLTLPGKIVEDGREKATFDIDKGLFTLHVPKETAGEHFEGLQMLTSLLAPKGSRSAKPLVEDMGACSGIMDGEEEDDEEEFDWQVEQEVYMDTSEEQLKELQKYGFGSQRSGVFTRLQEELSDVIDIQNPDRTTVSERRRKRLDAETSIFCPDHYLADLFEDEEIQGLLKFRPWWSDLCPDSIRQGEAAVSFTDDEKEQLRKFTNRSYILDKKSRFQVWLSLVDIILAYCYELRTTEGEHNVESPWTIRKLSGTLCWLETYSSLQEVLVSFGRRVLCYPLYRHFSLVSAAVQDAARVFQSGKACVLKCLLDIHKVFRENEPAYILNDLYITDYCVWLQRVKSRKVTALADPLRNVSLRKRDLDLELEVLETAATLVEEEEKVEDRGKSPIRTPLSHIREESDSNDSSSDSSEESEDSEAEGKDCADRTEGGGERAKAIPIHPQPAAPPIHQESGAVLTSSERKPSTPPSAVSCPRQLIQELGEMVEEGLWISAQPQGSRHSRSSAQGEAERDCSQPATATATATDTARTGAFLELNPRRNPLLIVKTDTGDDLDEDDIDEDDY
ncbi:protein SHQ1 homolog [Oncorhynchus masou masou]|uniref:protein SHQ1 homolog n=1 Tax=Oncorhynchus masou masou TaxID=90313 RepID=UPI003183D45B